MKRNLTILTVLVLLVGGFFISKDKFLNIGTPKQEIGEKVEDMGRDHVDDIFGVNYNSNPPTSGPHFPIWAKQGVYDRLISDGYYIHSMEHGYIVIWYNCDKLNTSYKFIPEVLAHGDEDVIISSDPNATIVPLMHMISPTDDKIQWITPESQPAAEVQLPLSFGTPACKSFVEKLKPFLNSAQRVIIAPRVNMDTKLAITAWNRILKLDSVDKEKIGEFIKEYHNKGPESTME